MNNEQLLLEKRLFFFNYPNFDFLDSVQNFTLIKDEKLENRDLKYIKKHYSKYINELETKFLNDDWFSNPEFDYILFHDKNIDLTFDILGEDDFFLRIHKIKNLKKEEKYTKLVGYIHESLQPTNSSEAFSFNYETAEVLLNMLEAMQVNVLELYKFILLLDYEVGKKLLVSNKFSVKLEPKKIALILDPVIYQRIVTKFQDLIDLDETYSLRRIKMPDLLINFNDKNLIDTRYYFDNDYDELDQQEILNLYMCDLISQYFFDDLFQNTYLDLKQIISFSSLSNQNILKERMDFYLEFIKLNKYTYEEKLYFLKKYQQCDFREAYYDDLNFMKEKSKKLIIDSTIKSLSKDSSLFKKDLSEKYGTEIYYLNGEEFYAFVRCNVNVKKGKEQPKMEEVKRLSQSFSFIGTDNISMYQNPNEILTLMYSGFDPSMIAHISSMDSWSYKKYESNALSSIDASVVYELPTPKSLLSSTFYYNEIAVKKSDSLKPIGLVCYDNFTEWDLEFSKRNNLPIVIINTNRYVQKHDVYEENAKFLQNRYIR